ncbi:MAG: GNAT family N-acetyltransferase [Microbacteriaceae bacterium]|nr:MAG: GNAT family N-acetyltransferase [Microbacteriaceae bacterium]
MVRFTAVDVTDARAHALLTDYFADRARTFPVSQGTYRTSFPDPAAFTPPAGVFLLVMTGHAGSREAAIGCGGIRRIEAASPGAIRYEMKHLWLQPGERGSGAGRALLTELEARARGFGATELVLDTNTSLTAAGGLYRSNGFAEIAPYNDNPNATTWLRKTL